MPESFLNSLRFYPVVTVWFAATILYLAVKRFRRRTLAYLPGPESKSWLLGNVPDLQRPEEAGDADYQWSQDYGLAFRMKGCFGEDILYLADPKGLQHILNKSGYNYPKTHESRTRQLFGGGQGILWAEGTEHSRHRKVMNPAFSFPALKRFLPVFIGYAQKTSAAWKNILLQENKDSTVINVSPWMARTTLDAIGTTAFGYNINAIEGDESELYKLYHNLFVEAHFMLSNFNIVFRRLIAYTPSWLTLYAPRLPKKDLRRLKKVSDYVHQLGRELFGQQMAAQDVSKGGDTDVMSILVRANSSEDPKRQLTEEEVLSQILTLTLAGHETTANTLGWALLELSKHPDVQEKLREEIKATRAKIMARGDTELSINDLETMRYTVAIMKETLRFHPIVLHVTRRAKQDDVIPLVYPQRTVTGEKITSIPVSAGQAVTVSLCVYNRIKSVWGEDADQFRPERFLEDLPNTERVNLGVFGNIASFSSGLRSCIGWRFAVLEMQAVMVELVENFAFSPAPGNLDIKAGVATIIQPLVKGQEHQGTQLPLTVTAINEA